MASAVLRLPLCALLSGSTRYSGNPFLMIPSAEQGVGILRLKYAAFVGLNNSEAGSDSDL